MMNILKEWKLLSQKYDSCSTEQEYHSFLMENKNSILKLYEMTYPELMNTIPMGDTKGGTHGVDLPGQPVITRAAGAGFGQNIRHPLRIGDIQVTFGGGRGEARTRRWMFSVPGDDWPNSSDQYDVTVQFAMDGPSAQELSTMGSPRNLQSLDVNVRCTCPFFRWNGPEYNAHNNGFLDGQPQANLSADQGVRDPNREYYICKHIAAVFTLIQSKFSLPYSYFRASEIAR